MANGQKRETTIYRLPWFERGAVMISSVFEPERLEPWLLKTR